MKNLYKKENGKTNWVSVAITAVLGTAATVGTIFGIKKIRAKKAAKKQETVEQPAEETK